MTQSMSRKGNCLDNAVMENFFGTLKSECFYLREFRSVSALRKAVEDYIHYYNNERISLKLKGLESGRVPNPGSESRLQYESSNFMGSVHALARAYGV